jgi:hypothetical protein
MALIGKEEYILKIIGILIFICFKLANVETLALLMSDDPS